MNKLAFAALGLLTRAGKSLAAFARHEKTDEKTNAPANRKRSKVAHKSARPTGGPAKLH